MMELDKKKSQRIKSFILRGTCVTFPVRRLDVEIQYFTKLSGLLVMLGSVKTCVLEPNNPRLVGFTLMNRPGASAVLMFTNVIPVTLDFQTRANMKSVSQV